VSNFEYFGAYGIGAGNTQSLSIAGTSVTKKHKIISIYGNTIKNNLGNNMSITSVSITVNGVAVESSKIKYQLIHARYYPSFNISVYDDIPAGATIGVTVRFSGYCGDTDYTAFGY
jgi:hypothetical protein